MLERTFERSLEFDLWYFDLATIEINFCYSYLFSFAMCSTKRVCKRKLILDASQRRIVKGL